MFLPTSPSRPSEPSEQPDHEEEQNKCHNAGQYDEPAVDQVQIFGKFVIQRDVGAVDEEGRFGPFRDIGKHDRAKRIALIGIGDLLAGRGIDRRFLEVLRGHIIRKKDRRGLVDPKQRDLLGGDLKRGDGKIILQVQRGVQTGGQDAVEIVESVVEEGLGADVLLPVLAAQNDHDEPGAVLFGVGHQILGGLIGMARF